MIERRGISVMAKDHPSVLPASSTDWDKAWDVISRLGVARKHLEHDTGAIAGGPLTAIDTEREAAEVRTLQPRSLHRPVSVWILIGALWISIGMIVSAAIVTVAFLA
jgi:hypothetical protein